MMPLTQIDCEVHADYDDDTLATMTKATDVSLHYVRPPALSTGCMANMAGIHSELESLK